MNIDTITLEELHQLYNALCRVTHDEVVGAMAATIGADLDYANKQWGRFRDNPVTWCLSRNPATQGEAMLRLAKLNLSKREDASALR